jgi:hypothetical protein
VAIKRELVEAYRDLLPDLAPHQWRQIRGRQDIIVRYAPDEALSTLPRLVANRSERERLLTVIERLLTDPRLSNVEPSTEQRATLKRIADALEVPLPRRRRLVRPARQGASARAP